MIVIWDEGWRISGDEGEGEAETNTEVKEDNGPRGVKRGQVHYKRLQSQSAPSCLSLLVLASDSCGESGFLKTSRLSTRSLLDNGIPKQVLVKLYCLATIFYEARQEKITSLYHQLTNTSFTNNGACLSHTFILIVHI